MCEHRAQLSLNDLPGVEDVDIERDEKQVTLTYKAGAEPDIETIKTTITNAGFTPGKAIVSVKQ
jgi:hypothetical protein